MMSPSGGEDSPLNHPLLKAAGCPASGNGAQVYLQQLTRSLEACQLLEIGTSTGEWLKEVRQLAKAVVSDFKQASQSPLPADLLHFPWGAVHDCIEARAKVKSQSTRHLDALFGLMLLEAGVGSGKSPVVRMLASALGFPNNFRAEILDKCSAVVLHAEVDGNPLMIRRALEAKNGELTVKWMDMLDTTSVSRNVDIDLNLRFTFGGETLENRSGDRPDKGRLRLLSTRTSSCQWSQAELC